MKVVAYVPVKGESSRVSAKNTRLLDGCPLFIHTLKKLINVSLIDEVYLDTESDRIIEMASHLPIKVMKRDPALATNATDGHDLFMNEVRHTEADLYIQVLCTSPFIRVETIEEGIKTLCASDQYDSAILMRREKQYLWQDQNPLYGRGRIPNSVDLPDTWIESMGMYMVKRPVALEHEKRFGLKPYLLVADPVEAIDVNTEDDLRLANFVAAGQREKELVLLRNLRSLLASPMLSDVLDDLGQHGNVLSGLNPNMDNIPLFGRVKTLELRALEEGESYEGIYDALQTYESIVPNDIILVKNEVHDFAYFGDLNARLAIRSGAQGAIINGVTRDTEAVKKLGFPVYARGTNAVDVRGRATMKAFNKKLVIDDVTIEPGDLIFADRDAIVRIPAAFERQVIQHAIEKIQSENKISVDIALNLSTQDIKHQHGAF